MSIEVVSILVTSASIIVTIWFGVGKQKAKEEVMHLREYLEFKKTEEFSLRYRETLTSYTKMANRTKWKEQMQGRDFVSDIDKSLTEFNTYLPKFGYDRRLKVISNIDEAKKEFAKVRKGDEDARDANIIRLNTIDRLFNEELAEQKQNFVELL